jgi:CRP-like cAMP-binding protein
LPDDQQLAAFEELKRTFEDGINKSENQLELIKKLHREYAETIEKKKKKPAKREGMFQKGLRMSNLSANSKKQIEQVEKTEETMELLRMSVMDTLFEDHDKRTIEAVLRSMRMRKVVPDEEVVQQGGTDAKFTVIETGKIEVLKDKRNQVNLNRGNMFGEMALIYDEPSPFAYIAREEGVIWELDRETFRQVQHVCAAKTLNERAKWISGIKILERLTKPQLAKVARALQARQVPKGKDIVTQGDMGDTFFIIQEGQVEVLVTDQRQASEEGLTPRAVDEMGPGDYFGEAALLTQEPRNATCRAKTDVVVLCLHSDDFSEVMGPLSELLDKNAVIRALQNVEALNQLSKHEVELVADQLEVTVFEAGQQQTIISVGEVSSHLFLVREGQLLCLDKDGNATAEVHDGLSFGEGCAQDQPERFTVKTNGEPAKVMKLSAHKLKVALGLLQQQEQGAGGGAEGGITKSSSDSKLETPAAASHRNRRGSKIMCSGPMSQIALGALQQLAVLGEGSFGQVTMVKTTHPASGEELVLALKRMCKQHIIESGQQEHIQRERKVLASLPENPFLLNLHSTYQDRDCIYMLTNLLQGGELFSLIHTFDGDIPLPVPQAKFYAANVFLALEHLHNHGVIYRDMKPENILLAADGYLCVIDLGFAKVETPLWSPFPPMLWLIGCCGNSLFSLFSLFSLSLSHHSHITRTLT